MDKELVNKLKLDLDKINDVSGVYSMRKILEHILDALIKENEEQSEEE